MSGRAAEAHTPSKNLPPVSRIQVHVAYARLRNGLDEGEIVA
jgi:hypothetical protein